MNHESLDKLNEKLNKLDPHEIIEWAFDHYDSNVGMITSFGYTGMVLLHHVLKVKPNIEIFFIDTGFHFKESLEFVKMVSKKWNINLTTIKPKYTKKELIKKIGDPPYEVNPDLCCQYNKVDCYYSIADQKEVWLSAIRRDQSSTRTHLNVLAIDKHGSLKIHPFVFWRRDQVWDFIKKNKIPYNPLHDEHYTSIGCEPCTIPTKAGSHERDGRWPHLQKLECGINEFRNGNK